MMAFIGPSRKRPNYTEEKDEGLCGAGYVNVGSTGGL